jgi:hypothetical protein
VSYPLVIRRSINESMRGVDSRITEDTYGRISWSAQASGNAGTLQVDSVVFVRDGQRKSVAPDGQPVARFVFHREGNGRLVVDSAPPGLRENPYLATLILELPALRPGVRSQDCRKGAIWTDSIVVGPVPVPGVDSLYSTYHATYRADSARRDTLFVSGHSLVTSLGRGAGLTVLAETSRHTSSWRMGTSCLGAAFLVEVRSGSIVYLATAAAPPDTVISTERREIAMPLSLERPNSASRAPNER